MRSGRCPKCEHDHILHVVEVADRAGTTGSPAPGERPEPLAQGTYHPLRIARIVNPDPRLIGPREAAVGLVEAYVCRRCGFTELYTRGAELIAPDGTQVRELVGPEPQGPYR
jgi:hypothetical protein